MKKFRDNGVAAMKHSLAGGQALHVFDSTAWRTNRRVPAAFRRHKLWAHLLDQNRERLVATARRLGVRRILVHGEGRRTQHVDLCGKPLVRAIEICDES